MLKIPIKYKIVSYPKKYGQTRSTFCYLSTTLTMDENILRIEFSKPNFFSNLFAVLPIEFNRIYNPPEKIYKNQFGEYKIKYSNKYKDFEITFLIKNNIPEDFERIFSSW